MLILAITLLVAVVSASNHQISLGRVPSINNGPTKSGIDVSPFIFTSLQGLLRQWQNVFAPTGHTIIPGTIPAHTLLYHARLDLKTPPSPEWFAFDIEMSYGIISPSGVCIMNTYAATRPIKVLYFDGMSAALSGNGTLDSQNVFLYGKVVDDGWDNRPGGGHRPGGGDKRPDPGGPGSPRSPRGPLQGEYKRANELCEWANGLGESIVEGFVRMNSGFELLWCDFNSSAIELVSRLNVTILAPVNNSSITEFQKSLEIDHRPKNPHVDCPPPQGDHSHRRGDHPHHCPPSKHEGDHHHNNPPPEHEGDYLHPPKGDCSLLKDEHRRPPPKGKHPLPRSDFPPSRGEYSPPHCHDGHPPSGCHPPSIKHCPPPPKDDHRSPKRDHPHHVPHKGHWGFAIIEFLRRLSSRHPQHDCHHGHPGHPPKDGHREHPRCKEERPPPRGHHPPPDHDGDHPPQGCHRPPPKHCPHPPTDGCPPPGGDKPKFPPPDGDNPPPYVKPPNGTYPNDPRQRPPFSVESRWEWVRSATWHYNLAPEARVILDYCRMTSYYSVSIPGRASAGTLNAKRSHRLKAIKPEQAELIKKEVENNLLSYQEENFYCSGVDWREVADGITRRYFARIMELRGLLSKAEHLVECRDRGAELAGAMKRIRGLGHAMIMPFLQLNDQDTEAAQKRCMKDYTGRVDVSRVGNAEKMLVGAVEGVMENVCKVVFGIYEDFITPTDEKAITKWSGKMETLMGWIDWAGWHRCNDACGWDEVCAIPLWPILGTPWEQGADEDLLFNPRCIGIEFMESGNGGWGPGKPPA